MNKQEWEFAHVACPNCGNTNLRQTLIGIAEVDDNYEDCVNSADCSECGWSGMVKDLVPANTGQEKPMPIKMLDYEGETYAATKDVVVAMLDFNKLSPEQLKLFAVGESDPALPKPGETKKG